MSEHGIENKITKAHTVLLTKLEDEGDVDHCFDKQGVLHKEFLEGEFYVQVLERLLKETSTVKPRFCEEGRWFLVHKNAPDHSARAAKCFLENHSLVEISSPLYSPA